MDKKKTNFNDKSFKEKVKEIIDKSKKLNLIKPLSSAFENTPCTKEEHKGKKESFCR